MKPNADTSRPGELAGAAVDLERKGAVKRSPSGQLSVSLDDVRKTEMFRRNVDALGRIRRQLVKAVGTP